MTATFLHPRSKLDRAIFASVAAMLAMNLFVLAGQLQLAHAPLQFAAAATAAGAPLA